MAMFDVTRVGVNLARICVPAVIESMWSGVVPEVVDRRLRWWGHRLVRDADIDLIVYGAENLRKAGDACIVMSNHESHYDIPVLFAAIPGRFRMAAKAELFRVPIWGRAMIAMGFIALDRRRPTDASVRLSEEGSRLLREGTSLWIAPEGTRSPDGQLGVFKSGGFRLAIKAQASIVPVAIVGTRLVMPRERFSVCRGQRVSVSILPPVDAACFSPERVHELSAKVRELILAERDRIRAGVVHAADGAPTQFEDEKDNASCGQPV